MAHRPLSVYATAASLLVLTALSGCASVGGTAGGDSAVESSMSVAHSTLMKQGDKALDNGELQQAAAAYGRAAQFAPQDVSALIKLSEVMWRMKNVAESVKVLERAKQIAPDNKIVMRNLGRGYVAQNEAKKAQNAYLSALALDPSDIKTLTGLGVSYDLGGDHETAQRHYRAALATKPNEIEAQNNLGYSYILSKKYEEAIALLAPIVEQEGATQRQRQNLAMAYGMLGREDDVRRIAAKDLTPVEIERNLAVYRQLRNADTTTADLKEIGKPSFESGGLNTKATEVLEVLEPAPVGAATKPVTVAEVTSPTKPIPEKVVAPTPAPVKPAPAKEAAKNEKAATPLLKETASAPMASAPIVAPAEKASKPTPAPKLEDEVLAKAAEPKAKLGEETMRQNISPAPQPAAVPAPTPTPEPAPAAALAAPAATQAPTSAAPTPLVAASSGSQKIYLGKFASENAAQEAWIRVWTSNSAILGSLVASVEPAGTDGQASLYASGATSKEQAQNICTKLRENGISCGLFVSLQQ